MYQRRSWHVAQLAALPGLGLGLGWPGLGLGLGLGLAALPSLGRIPSTLSPGSPVRHTACLRAVRSDTRDTRGRAWT